MSMASRVPGNDGRAGMAAIVCDGNCDLAALHAHLDEQLAGLRAAGVPAHRKDIDVTGTFKQKKIDLVREGFDPDAITDPLYFNDWARAFVPLDATL